MSHNRRGKGRKSASPDLEEDAKSSPKRSTPSPPVGSSNRLATIVRARHHVRSTETQSPEEMAKEQARLKALQEEQQEQRRQMREAIEKDPLSDLMAPQRRRQQPQQQQQQQQQQQRQQRQQRQQQSRQQHQQLLLQQQPHHVAPEARPTLKEPINLMSSYPTNAQAPQVPTQQGPTLLPPQFSLARGNPSVNGDELSLKVKGIPYKWTLLDLYNVFEQYGSIDFMELYEHSSGDRSGNGRIRFSPAPTTRFWEKWPFEVPDERGHPLRLILQVEESKPPRMVPSPVDPNKLLPEKFTFLAETLDFGIMFKPMEMLSMYRTHKASPVRFTVNLFRRRLDVIFKHDFRAPPPEDLAYRSLFDDWKKIMREYRAHAKMENLKLASDGVENKSIAEIEEDEEDDPIETWERDETYRFQIPFEYLESLLEQPMEDPNTRSFVITLKGTYPPEFYRRLHETWKSFSGDRNERTWSEWDAWFRQTGITYQPECLHILPTTLRQPYSNIDIGRWTTYRFSFKLLENKRSAFEDMLGALKDFNIGTRLVEDLKLRNDIPSPVWEIIDPPRAAKNLIEELEKKQYLPFSLRYQLEAVISRGCLSEYNLDAEFVRRLKSIPESQALAILEHVYQQNERVYEPLTIFNSTRLKTHVAGLKIESYCVILRRAIITPTTIRFESPSIEYSNRVLRRWAEHADKFLRVQFTDEAPGDKLRYQKNASKDDVFTRVHNTLLNGIVIGDRRYEFLAFGSSQFREHGAYMFASDKYITAADIRKWMGTFDKIRVIGKYCARLGQCFSATRAITGVRVNVQSEHDIVRNGKTFTDGVGKMSQFVARMIAQDLNLSGREPPSAYQFRLSGCKGVLAVSPSVQNSDIITRPSQEKFTAEHRGLEIIRPAAFASASLNRQLILVLTALDVPGNAFEDMLQKQLDNMRESMINPQKALEELTKNIDENQMSLAIASMINDGFMESREPFLMTLLQLWRAHNTKNLKEKTKVTVENGAFLLGVVDETGIMKGHFDVEHHQTDEEKLANLPEVFCQVSDCKTPGQYKTIQGVCIIARNPSLHPGDVRVVRAVDVPELRHLRDVLVLPQTGDRDLAGMCSGGDLDGDDYFISWDERLIPKIINYEPMDYTAPQPANLDRPVNTDDMISFFVTYMKNDRLGHIANTHVAWADYLDEGVLHPRCIELAGLHSTAVDYPKTGYPAIMPRSLRPQKYPHFMEKRNGEKTYRSRKILGRLYDLVERVDFIPMYSADFDSRILSNPNYIVSERLLRSAKAVKIEYDVAMRRILGQYDIKTEFEIFSTFVLKYKACRSDYNFHEELGRIQKTLFDRFQKLIHEKVGGKKKSALASFVVAMYKVTHQEVVVALRQRDATKKEPTSKDQPVTQTNMMNSTRMPLVSFPWIFRDILGLLAKSVSPYNGKVEYDPPTFKSGGKEKEKLEDLPELDYYNEFPGLGGTMEETSSGHDTSQDECEA